ncbi:hypothetical protein BCR44DRAFT_1058380 [Catenaria anguillulae PL171]|uniref:Uncharacterized protein n=1 Tax=Catenaria anguillulae PL171 TaxID=765915 RepID=A0A1Y2HQ54_9FUNG|nr:hypothetical protein BCR44DRAFT_1058380 [Catenaria anguillulae PL171]
MSRDSFKPHTPRLFRSAEQDARMVDLGKGGPFLGWDFRPHVISTPGNAHAQGSRQAHACTRTGPAPCALVLVQRPFKLRFHPSILLIVQCMLAALALVSHRNHHQSQHRRPR